MSQPSSYLRYLPAVYGGQGSEFVGDYLNIFEKLLTGIKNDPNLNNRRGIQELLAPEVIGNLFYPRLSFLFDPTDTEFIPPISGAKPDQEAAILADLDTYIGVPTPTNPLAGFTGSQQSGATSQSAVQAWLNSFLNWLGGWVDLVPDASWDIDKKRRVIAQILALYRMRGTPQGLGFLIDLLLDLPLTIQGVMYQPGQDGLPATTTTVPGQVTVAVSNPVPPCITVCDTVKDVGRQPFIVQQRYRPGTQVVAGYFPWSFNVQINLPNADNDQFILTYQNVMQILGLQQQLQQLLPRIKPAASQFSIAIMPSMELLAPDDQTDKCNASTLGSNTFLGLKGKST